MPDPNREGCYIAGQIRKKVEYVAKFGKWTNLVQPSDDESKEEESKVL